VLDTWFWAYRLDDEGYRGTSSLPQAEFDRVREHIPSARIVSARGSSLDVRVSEADLRMLRGAVVPLSTRIARFGGGIAALFGDFEVPCLAGERLGLYYLGSNCFNGFHIGLSDSVVGEGDMPGIVSHLPSARLQRDGAMAIVEVDEADLAMLLRTAETA
jgi:hypothetical protein